MNLLAIDTSTEIASLALKVKGEMRSESLAGQKMQAQKILPMIDGLLAEAGLSLNQLNGIVFGQGPGSFTGLRVACSIAKGLACAVNIPLFPVSTLAAIAEETRTVTGLPDQAVLAVLDARMQELYWGYFPGASLKTEERVSPPEAVILPEGNNFLLAGLGFELYPSVFSSFSGTSIHPKAAFMIQLVEKGFVNPVKAADAQPLYIRNTVTQG